MNWEAAGAVGEIVGAVAVLITLVYLAAQIKQSNDLARFSASKELMNQFNGLNRLVTTDATLRQTLMKTADLSDEEREQVYNFAMMYCNVWYSMQAAYDNGQIDRELYAAGCKDVQVELDRWPAFRAAVAQWLKNYPEVASHEIFKPAVHPTGEPGDAAV